MSSLKNCLAAPISTAGGLRFHRAVVGSSQPLSSRTKRRRSRSLSSDLVPPWFPVAGVRLASILAVGAAVGAWLALAGSLSSRICALAVLFLVFVMLSLDVFRRFKKSAQPAQSPCRTELKASLPDAIGERTAQLESRNEELEAFAYSISHDLRAPLRTIRGLSEVLLESSHDQLDQRNQDFLRRICESSHQMSDMIEGLLRLSVVGRGEFVNRPVNLSLLARSIANGLQQQEPERTVEFSIAPHLTAMGDERLLHIVLENLLGNAWKFTSNRSPARIEVCSVEGPEPTFMVRDNGAGFEMKYAKRLFGVFQRLHSDREFPGTGIGLATVQRIIKRHGGRIWAEGAVNQGASFSFTLPAYASF